MKIWNRRLPRVIAATAIVSAALLVGPAAPVHAEVAEVWDCGAYANTSTNVASGLCYGGFGTYRVAAKCNSAHYPYTRTIVGQWVTKRSTDNPGPVSRAYGDAQGCHVVSAWVQVR